MQNVNFLNSPIKKYREEGRIKTRLNHLLPARNAPYWQRQTDFK
jgi:hypothetical protein